MKPWENVALKVRWLPTEVPLPDHSDETAAAGHMKAHLIDSAQPLNEGTFLLANCLEKVPNARFVFYWDNENYPEFLSISMTRICCYCARSPLKRKHVYGVVVGQEGMTEREAASNLYLDELCPIHLRRNCCGRDTMDDGTSKARQGNNLLDFCRFLLPKGTRK